MSIDSNDDTANTSAPAPGPDPARLRELDDALARFEGQKRWQDVIRTLQAKAELLPDPGERIALHERIAGIFIERFSNQAEAIKAYEAVLDIDPENPRAAEFLKGMYEKRKDWDKLLKLQKREARKAPPAVQFELYLGLARFVTDKVKKPEMCMELWEEVRSRDPANTEALGQLSGFYERGRDFPKLAQVLREQAAQTTDTAGRVNLLVKLGMVAGDKVGDDALAVEAWRGVLALDANDRRAQEALKKRYVAMHAWDDLELFFADTARWDELLRVLERELESPSASTEQKVALAFKIAQVWALRKERQDRAAKFLEKVLELDPTNRRAAEALAPIYEAAGDSAHLASVLEVRLLGDTDAARRATLRQLGGLYEGALRAPERALERYQQAFTEAPLDPRSWDDLARLAGTTGAWDAVARQLQEECDRRDAAQVNTLRLELGRVLARHLGRVDDAVECYRAVLGVEPEREEALADLEALLRDAERWPELLAILERRLVLAPTPEARRPLRLAIASLCEDRVGDLPRAVEACLEVLAEGGDDDQVLARLDGLYQRQEQWEALADVLARRLLLAEADGDDGRATDARYRRGRVLEDHLGRARDALEHYRELLALAPDHGEARAALERLLRDPELRAEAARVLEPVYELRGDWEALVRSTEILLSEEENLAERVRLLSRIGEVCTAHLGDARRAFEAYGRAFREAPAEDAVRNALLGLAEATHGWEDVVTWFRAASHGAPRALSRALLLQVADLEFRRLGAIDRAVEAYDKVLAEDPGDAEVLAALDGTYRAAGRWQELLAVYRKRLELCAEPAAQEDLLAQIAGVYETQLHRPDAALDTWRELHDHDPGNARALDALERLHHQLAHWPSLAEVLQTRLGLTSDPDAQTAVQLRLAEVFEAHLGDLPSAVELYRQIVARDPGSAAAVGHLERLVQRRDSAPMVAEVLEEVYRQLGDFERLVWLFEVLAAFADNIPRRVELLHQIADLQETAGRDDLAFQTHLRALAQDPSDSDSLGHLDRLSVSLGNHQELLAALEAQLARGGPAEALAALHARSAVVAEERLDDFERAIGHQNAILGLDPANLAAATALERLYQLADRPQDLAGIFLRKAAMLTDTTDRKAYYLNAAELAETVLGRTEDAIQAYWQIVAVDPEDLGALGALIRLFIAGSRWTELLDVYERKAAVVDDADEKRRLLFEVAAVYESELQDGARAIDAYNRILELDPTELLALQRLDALYTSRQDWRELQSVLEREASLTADTNELCAHRYRIAELHERQFGDVARAVELYGEILGELPDHPPALEALTRILHGEAQPLAAAAVLEPVFNAAGAFERVVEVLEVQLAHSTDPPQAVELLHRVAEISETVLDNPRAAFEAYARAVALDPGHDQTLGSLERLAGVDNTWAPVVEVYDRAVAGLTPGSEHRAPLLLRAAQIAEVQLGDVEGALRRYVAVLETEPESVPSLHALDRLYEATERWPELAQVLERELSRVDCTPEELLSYRYRLGQVRCEHLGDAAGALAAWREVLDAQADHPEALAALEALFSSGTLRPELFEVLEPLYRLSEDWEKLSGLLAASLDWVSDPVPRVELLHRLAELAEERLGDPTAAQQWYARALREHPLDERSYAEAERLSGATGEWAALADTLADLIDGDAVPAQVRQTLGKRLARIHENELMDLEAAEAAYEFVLGAVPLDSDALEALDRLHTAAGEAEKLAQVLDRRVHASTDTEEKVELSYRLGQLLQDPLGRTDEAVARYRSVLDGLDGRHEPTLDALEAIYLQGEKWPELYDVYARKLDVATAEDVQAELQARMARLSAEYLGRPDDAVQRYEQVLQLRGEDPETLGALADLHEAAARWPELIDVLERLLAAESDPERRTQVALRIPGVHLHHLGDTERALEGYKRVLDIDVQSFEALRALAEIYRHGAQWDELVATLQTVTALGTATLPDEELKAVYTELGGLFAGTLSQPYEAVEAYNRVLELDPRDGHAIEALLALHTAQEQWTDVVSTLEKKVAATEDPEARVAVLLQVTEVWRDRLQEPDTGRAAYEKVLELSPLHEGAFVALEDLHREAGRWDDLATLYIARHDKLTEIDRVKEAVPFMREAAVLYDEKLQDPEQALAAAQLAFDEDVDDAETVKVLERLAAATSRWNEILKTTLEAYQSEQGPRKTSLGLHVARWYGVELGHPEWAIPIYNQILAQEPTNLQALQSMAGLYRKLGQWQPLGQVLQKAVDVARAPADRRRAHLELGEVLEKYLSRVDNAVEQYRSALALDPSAQDTLVALSRVHAGRGEWAELVEVLRQGVTSTPEPTQTVDMRLQVAEILEDRLGEVDQAITEYRGVLDLDAQNLAALRGLERLFARTGNAAELLRVLEAELEVVGTERERIKLLTRIGEMLEEEFVRPDQAVVRFEAILEIDPGNDGALRALERLYRNTSQWDQLLFTLERHLTATVDRRERVPIFEAMGQVYEEEKHDLDHAEDAYLNILQIDNDYPPALEALGRVYEAKGDPHRTLETLEQLAGLLSHDVARSVELRCRMAKIALDSLQDEERARELYQSALDVHPDHAPALAALRDLATRREDWHDVSRFLDREQAVTEQPRVRARLLAEMGRVAATYLEEPDKAIACYEEAIRCDPDLEEAALPLAQHYAEHQRWAEAEPLAEMLSRKASRRDPGEQLELQLMMGRVAHNLGKYDRAIKALTVATGLDRTHIEAIRALADAYFEKKDWESAAKQYQVLMHYHREALPPEGRADILHRQGVLKREQGDRRRAAKLLEEALQEVPGYRPALLAQIETFSAAGEWEPVIAAKSQLLEQETDPNARYEQLLEIGGLWQEKTDNLQKAIQSYNAALELRPQERPLLHTVMDLYQRSGQWSKVVEVVGRIAGLTTDPVAKAKYEFTLGLLYNDRVKNPDEAVTHHNLALDANPDDLRPFAKINEILTAKRDFKNLERNFRKMLHRIANKGKPELEFNLLHNLGIIYRDRLGQMDAAIKAFQMASDKQPTNLTEHRILAELYTRAEKTPEALQRWTKILEADVAGEDAQGALHALYDLYYKGHQFDRAWCVAATATFLLRGSAREDVRAFHETYKPRREVNPTGRLSEEHWIKCLFHPNEDPVVGKVFASVLGALRKAKVQPVARFGFTQKEQQDPATSSVSLVKALGKTATALSLPTPWIFLQPGKAGGLGHVPSDPIASVAGNSLLSGLKPEELAFVAAKHMAMYRNEHYIRVLFPSVQEITAIYLACIRLVKPDQEVPPEALQTAQDLGPRVAQDPLAVEGLRKVVKVLLDQGGTANIKRWYQAVELTAARAGLLLAGDLEVAKKMLALEPGLPGDAPPAEKLKDLTLFSLSEDYFTLREALGITLQTTTNY